MISTAMRKRSGEDKLSSRISFVPFPVTCFALCTGAYSDPVLNVYTARNVTGELEEAKKEFLQANVIVKGTSKIFLPKLLDRYAKEAFMSSDDLLAWVSENVDRKLHNAIQKCMDSHPRRKTSQVALGYIVDIFNYWTVPDMKRNAETVVCWGTSALRLTALDIEMLTIQ
ncbi:hypothetical protein Taro_034722 [Colocasia esculenta]|uniref:DUF547 domain-containing protein n=1 Tax=Colocasia esculenta TaxID=4460 RepID=A0A843W1P2_COLES|nr:hypothetical protein [Colocasia esculenta]